MFVSVLFVVAMSMFLRLSVLQVFCLSVLLLGVYFIVRSCWSA
jgi:hypothetical protein